MKKYFSIFILAAVLGTNTFAQVITVSTLSTGFTRPVGIVNSGLPNDNRLFVLEKLGRIRIIDRVTGAVNPTPFLNITSIVRSSSNEQGLLGLAFHPDYANNGYFYVFYTSYAGPNGNNVLARYQVSSFADTALTNSGVTMMTIYKPATNHNGGNLMFDWDGYLYVSVGDGGIQGDAQGVYGNAQHIDSILGKVLRLDISNPNPPYYFSPSINPFYGHYPHTAFPYIGDTLTAKEEICYWGLRNPWRASIDRMTGDKWVGDVGQGSYEEVDYESRCDTLGNNFGWRCFEGFTSYNSLGCQGQSSYTSPVFAYSHGLGCSISGGYVYRGGQEGALFGKYLCGDYCTGRIWSVYPNGTGGWNNALLTQTNALLTNNISTWGEDIYGEIYLAGDATGNIYRVRDTACAPTAYINTQDTIINCTGGPMTFNAIYGTGLTYTWYVDGLVVLSGTSDSLSNSFSNGEHTVWVVVNGNCPATSNVIHIFTDASFTTLDSLYCINAAVVPLTGLPAGGTFSGPGITGNVFDPNVAGVGTHMIIYTYSDTVSTCRFAASNCVLVDTQYVVVDLCLGIEEQNNIHGVRVYPNPNHSEFNVEFSMLQNSEVALTVKDAIGRIVYERKVDGKRGKQNISVSLSSAPGIYFLFLKTKSSASVSKVIVQR